MNIKNVIEDNKMFKDNGEKIYETLSNEYIKDISKIYINDGIIKVDQYLP